MDLLKFLNINWRNGERCHRSGPRREHLAQGSPLCDILQQQWREPSKLPVQFPSPVPPSFFMPQHYRKLYFYNTLGYMRVLQSEVTCPGALTTPGPTRHFQGLKNSLSQPSYDLFMVYRFATAHWLRSSALGRCVYLVEPRSYSLAAKEDGKASINFHLLFL